MKVDRDAFRAMEIAADALAKLVDQGLDGGLSGAIRVALESELAAATENAYDASEIAHQASLGFPLRGQLESKGFQIV